MHAIIASIAAMELFVRQFEEFAFFQNIPTDKQNRLHQALNHSGDGYQAIAPLKFSKIVFSC